MKNTGFLLFAAIILTLVSCTNDLKDRDGNTYGIVKIGKQEWMDRNLSTSRFRNGDPIPEAKTPEEWLMYTLEGKPVWCVQKNDPDNIQLYGKLYNWYAVNDERGLAPKGWHIPTDDEWKAMTDYLGGEVAAALTLRSSGLASENGTGFKGLAAGCCNSSGAFGGVGSYGYWWTGSEANASSVWARQLNYVICSINSLAYDKNYGMSVRCIKD
jgi:uncharacterized protein (TIGR02145 family)